MATKTIPEVLEFQAQFNPIAEALEKVTNRAVDAMSIKAAIGLLLSATAADTNPRIAILFNDGGRTIVHGSSFGAVLHDQFDAASLARSLVRRL